MPLAGCAPTVLPVVHTTPGNARTAMTPTEALNHAYSPTTAKNKELYGTRSGPLVASQVSYKRVKAGCPAPVGLYKP